MVVLRGVVWYCYDTGVNQNRQFHLGVAGTPYSHTHTPRKQNPGTIFWGLKPILFIFGFLKKKTPDINPTNKTKNVYPEDPNTKDRRRGIFGEGEL